MHWELKFLDKDEIIYEGDFLKDQFFVYEGMFGIPSFCIWWMADDKTNEIYLGRAFSLELFNETADIYFSRQFVIESAIYDSVNNIYKIYAVDIAFNDLKKADYIEATTFTNNKDKPLSGARIISSMIYSRFNYINLFIDQNLKERVNYFAASFDSKMSCLDLITKICDENEWEWHLDTNRLYIRNYHYIPDSNIAPADLENESSKIINFKNYKYVQMRADNAHPGSSYGDGGPFRVLWVVFYMGGEIGGTMGVMLQKRDEITITEEKYLKTLLNIPESLILERKKDYKQDNVIVGNIFGKYSDDNIDHYESPTFSGDVKKYAKWLRKREFKKSYSEDEIPLLYNKDVIMTTPYSGDGVGILFPQGESNRILFSPGGERETPLIGPGYFGFDEEVPKRTSNNDFRLQLPGCVLYIKENGDITYEIGKNHAEIPDGTDDEVGIHLENVGDVSTPQFTINLGGGSVLSFSEGSNGSFNVTASGSAALLIAKRILLSAGTTGTGDLDLQALGGDITLQGINIKIDGGTIDINGTTFIKGGIVNATMVSTKGGNVPPNVV